MNAFEKKWPVYNPKKIEPKLQSLWEEQGLNLAQSTSDKPKFYCLDFFPYPSGDGLHVGHCRNYVPTDVLSRYKRMQGFNVLHPMGWDAFGEPAEQFAVAQGVHPRITTDQNTANFRRQMRMIGTSYDWSREIDSSDPEFYHWTQYFFLMLYQRGLAYRDTNWQWWCPTCQTTLSSHEVNNGVCWRGHAGVSRREIPAWYFKITAYADQLLDGLDNIDWPDRIKTMQRNWIGRSEGCEIIFQTGDGERIPVFTTRPDTVYGVTFFVLAPEHPMVGRITSPNHSAAVINYQNQSAQRSESERLMENREKTGVFTGGYVINPLSAERVPVWVADYVLPSYGTGAVMGVPGHDSRDFQFASRYELPVKVVIAAQETIGEPSKDCYDGPGMMVNSGAYSGQDNAEGARQICIELQRRSLGGPKVIYRMRDWLISRQRYWGTPIPIVYCTEHGEQPVPEDQLPVQLPPMERFQPDGSGRSPLARIPEFVNTTCPVCNGPARRETDTMGGFACSSWYFLRFTSPHDEQGPFEPEAVKYWMPVDLYVGGAEHAVLHLLFARFWTRVMADAGMLPFSEPFSKLLNQGQLLAPDGSRMSKSRGNVITPDSVVQTYGADALRIYVLFMAPFDQDIKWNMDGIHGAQRFLNRIWNLIGETYQESEKSVGSDAKLEHWLHQTIRKVSEKIEAFRLNTMVSSLMEFVNVLSERQQSNEWHTKTYHCSLETLMVILAPSAPYMADALWSKTGHIGSVHQQPWPSWKPDLASEEIAEVAIQINGKVREVIQAPAEASQEEVQEMAFASPKVQSFLLGHSIDKMIYIPGKILSVVTMSDARKTSAD
jgi:leucyl-tRNA synthetase